ncbi:thymidylate synthase [Candidatus Marsarchaeota archaeon]|jgi:thymidylate synthase|nr:thymidylate synthase [Candidatus Marsarchaeota archaeon]
MQIIEAATPGLLWKQAAKKVYSEGSEIMDGQERLKELTSVTLIISNPTGEDQIMQKFADRKMVDFMLGNFLKQDSVLDWGYSYGKRLFNYNGINQMDRVIKKLNGNKESKSATIDLINPLEDVKHVPCICTLDFKIRDNKIQCSAFFRSQDAGKKIYADIISIGKLMKIIAKETKYDVGVLHIFIASLHIYEKDVNDKILPLIS